MKYSLSQFEDTGLLARSRPGRNPLTLAAVVCAWMASVGNIALWQELIKLKRLSTSGDWAVAACLLVVTWAGLMLLTSLFAWRRSIKLWLTFLLLVSAFGAHFMTSYGVVIDPSMMTNVLQTDTRETLDLLNLRLLLTVLVLAVVPAALLWRSPVQRLKLIRQSGLNAINLIANLLIFTAAIAVFFQGFSALMRNQTHVRYLLNPLNSIYSTGMAVSKPLRQVNQTLQPIGADARLASFSGPAPVLLLVIGETARAANFSLGGYERQTTPKLAQLAQSDALVYQSNAWSCGTNTADSLPCMFSHLAKDEFEDTKLRYENLLDVLQRAGLAVLWIDNQSGCKGLCARVPTVNISATNPEAVPEHCASGECHDKVMLHKLQERITTLPAAQRAQGVVVVLHQMGSHGPAYFKRVPPEFQTFTPICKTSNLSECSREQIVNSYDNTISYTDDFLAAAIQTLKTSDKTALSALLYVSDHGESLGENGLYLHGMPYAIAPKEQKHIPWLTWFSPAWVAQRKVDTSCLKAKTQERITHDNMFHSVLGLMRIQTSVYTPELDIYAKCTQK